MERKSGKQLTGRFCESEDRGKPYTRWIDGAKKVRGAKTLELRDEKLKCIDKKVVKGLI